MIKYLFAPCLLLSLFACNDSAKTDAGIKDSTAMDHMPAFDKDKARAEIDSHNQKFMNDFKNGDSAALEAHYASDGIAFPSNSDMVPRANLAAMWGSVYRMGLKELKVTTKDISGNNDMIAEHGLYELYNSKNAIADKGKYVVVWKKENGDWKILYDIWNTSMPAK